MRILNLSRKKDLELRCIYEKRMGRICDKTWLQVKKFLNCTELKLTPDSLAEYAFLRYFYPRIHIEPSDYDTIRNLFFWLYDQMPGTLSGAVFVSVIKENRINPHISTIYRWFDSHNLSYSAKTIYTKESIKKIVFRAAVWYWQNVNGDFYEVNRKPKIV